VGELDDGLAAGVRPDPERSDSGEGLAARGEEVEVGVRLPVAIVPTRFQVAPGPPALKLADGGSTGVKPGTA
jgi:hypothetical protein